MKRCRICEHILRNEIEDLYRNGKTIRQIEQFCKENNLGLTYAMVYHHLTKHYKCTSNITDTSNILNELVSNLITNLQICNDKISNMVKDARFDDSVLLRYLNEIRQTISDLRSFLRDYPVQTNKNEDVFRMILYLMHDLPLEWIRKFEDRYREFKANPNIKIPLNKA